METKMPDEAKKILKMFGGSGPQGSIKALFEIIEVIARENYDGHYTLMKFTTNYKFMFGTPSDREDIILLPGFKCKNDAIINAIIKNYERN